MDISPALEDYLESILIIRNKNQVVRVKDIAAFLQVKAPSVSDAVGALKKKGLVQQERYGYIELTETGLKQARKIFSKHTSLTSFFTEILALDNDSAEEEACKIEHFLSKKTLERIKSFGSFFDSHVDQSIKQQFKQYLEAQAQDASKNS